MYVSCLSVGRSGSPLALALALALADHTTDGCRAAAAAAAAAAAEERKRVCGSSGSEKKIELRKPQSHATLFVLDLPPHPHTLPYFWCCRRRMDIFKIGIFNYCTCKYV